MYFVFYDLETTGISPAFDQPIQFAVMLTDKQLSGFSEASSLIRLAPHIIPSPKALIVTGISPNKLALNRMPSLFEFAQHISSLTKKWAPAIWVGYNSMKFDEEFLRQTFYQNLQPSVYATQFDQNARFDILPALYAVYVRHRDLLTWPIAENGEISFKLEHMAHENGFTDFNAHNAMEDVHATCVIAKKIAFGSTALWNELLENVHKASVQKKLESFQLLDLITRFGGEPRSHIGCFCGYSESYKAQAGFFDLDAADPADLIEADDATLFAAVNEIPKIIHTVSTNKVPTLLKAQSPSAEHIRRAQLIADAPEFRQRVGQALAARFVDDPDAPPKPVEKQIYGKFYSRADEKLLDEFQDADWPRRQEIVFSLSDPRLRQLGRRLIAFYSPELLSDDVQESLTKYFHEKWKAPDVPETEWMTLEKARAEIAELKVNSKADPVLLREIEEFIELKRAG